MVKMQPRPAVVGWLRNQVRRTLCLLLTIGFDIHKKTINFCAKAQDGTILEEGTIPARRDALLAWAKARPRPWIGAMEATLFTGWIYDLLKPLAQALKVAHPPMLKAIAVAKKKNDKQRQTGKKLFRHLV